MFNDSAARLLKIALPILMSVALASCDSSKTSVPPVDVLAAVAGADQSVGEGAVVTLDGSASTGAGITYAWTQIAGTAVALSDATASSPTFTAPIVVADEILTFTLTVTDNSVSSDSDTVNITVRNGAPTANAGPDQTVIEGAAVALDGTASSQMVGGTIISFAWVQTAGTPVLNLAGENTATPTFNVAMVGANEVVTFELTVTDDDGDTDTDTVDINVLNDTPPVAIAGPNQTVDEGTAVTLDGSTSSDAVGVSLTFAWNQTAGPAVALTGANTAMPTFTAPQVAVAGATLTFELTVTDDSGQSDTDSVDINVQNVNQSPVANAGPDQMISEGVNVMLDGTASTDPDGTIAAYAWTQTSGPAVVLNNANTATPDFVAPLVAIATPLVFELTVTDDGGAQATDSVNVDIVVFNIPPTANAGPNQAVDDSSNVTLDGSGSADADGAIASYAWVQTAGTVVVLNNANTVSPDFTAPDVTGAAEVLTFELTVTDNNAAIPKADTDTVDITVNPFNEDPVADAGPDQTVLEQSAVNLDGTASVDNDGSIAAFQWTQTAGTVVVLTGATTATPSFTAPTVLAAGELLTFQLEVTDNEGATATDTVDIQVDNDPLLSTPPSANAGPDQTVNAAVIVTLDGSASSDPDGTITAYQWTQTGGTVVALTNANAAVATFTSPAAPDVLTFQLEVTDDDAATDTDTVVITVNAPPIANAGLDQTVLEQTLVNLDGTGSTDPGGSIASYAWVQTAGTAVVLNNANTSTPSFTAPGVTAAGDLLTFELTVTDNAGATATDTVDIQVDNDPALSTPPTANAGPDQTVNAAVIVTLDGSASSDPDGTITAYQWTQTGGTVVALTNANAAVATFTSPAAPDVLTFQLEVTDDDAATDTDTVVITVNAPPVANAGPDQTVLEQVVVNLNGAGSTDPGGSIASFAWVQTAGTAVVLTGASTATPSFTAPAVLAAGELLTFQLTVTDGPGLSDTDTVNIQVDNDPLLSTPPTANAGPDQTVNAAVVVNLDGTGSSDADGTIVSFQWTQTGGAVVVLTGASTATPSFTSPAAPDVLTFQLEVTDDDAATDTDTVVITVNAPPVANAGPDQTVLEQVVVNLNGAGSTDPGGSIASFAWVQTAGTAVTLTGANTATPSFTAPAVLAAGELLTFQLTVTDGPGLSDTDTVNIQVDNDPLLSTPPTAAAGADQTVNAAVIVTLDGSASSDPDGTITAYQWTQTGGTVVALTNANAAVATFTSPAAPDVLTFELEVTDDDAATNTDTVVITVNAPPVANAGPNQSVLENVLVNLNGSGSSDVDGTIASFSWVQTVGTAVVINNATTATPSFTSPMVTSAGELLTFEVTVTDDDGATDSDTVDVQVNNDPALNILPTAVAGPDQTVGQSVLVTLDGSASSDDGSITAFQWTQTAGTAVTLTNAGTAVATFTSPALPGALTFQLEVTDDETGTDTDTVVITVTGQVTISGTITFHEIPHGTPGTGLNYTSIVALPARLVTVQLIDNADGTTVLASTSTDASGDYSLLVDSSTDVFLRVRAEMIDTGGAPSWDFQIVDNTSSDALYVLDTTNFNTGIADSVVDVLAETAFDGNDYTARNSPPFAILDAVYDSFQTVLGVDPTRDFVPLDIHWSINNRTVFGNESIGEIGTSFYRGGNPIDGIFLLGMEDDDTEEFDQHVIIHEWGHYYEDTIARSDSIGGPHGPGDLLGIRVAFGEGWGNAYSGIASGNTTYLDSFGPNQSLSGGFDVEDGTLLNGVNPAPGWYSERSIQEILFDLVDANADGADTLNLGFGPLHSVFTNQQTTTTAFTSIFSFIDGLKSDLPGDAAAIDALLASQSIDTVGDAYGAGETNNAGSADTLPVYKTVTVNGGAVNVCSDDAFGGDNKLNTTQFVRVDIPTAGNHTFTAITTVFPGATTDPDMWLRRPPLSGIFEIFESQVADSETGVSINFLATGEWIIEVFDFNNRGRAKLLAPIFAGPSIGRTCFNITVTLP